METRQETVKRIDADVRATLGKIHKASGDMILWNGISNWIDDIYRMSDPRIDIGSQNNMKLYDNGAVLSGPSDDVAFAIRKVIKTRQFVRFLRDTVSAMAMDSAKELDANTAWLEALRDQIDKLPPPPAD